MIRTIANIFALIGLWATTVVAMFYIGYATYCPPCHTVASVFTKECK